MEPGDFAWDYGLENPLAEKARTQKLSPTGVGAPAARLSEFLAYRQKSDGVRGRQRNRPAGCKEAQVVPGCHQGHRSGTGGKAPARGAGRSTTRASATSYRQAPPSEPRR